MGLLESPQRIVLFPCSDLDKLSAEENSDDDEKASSKRKPIKIGPELESTILEGINGYRTSAPEALWLEELLEEGKLIDLVDMVSPSVFQSLLLEDKPTSSGDDDFNEWKARIAELVREEIEDDDEDNDRPSSRGFLRRLLPFGRKSN